MRGILFPSYYFLGVDLMARKKKVDSKLNKEEKTIEKEEAYDIKKYKVRIYNVEDNCVLANVGSTPKRIYFDLTFKDLEYYREHKNSYKNKILNIYYIGNLSDIKNVKILPIKSLDDIGGRF